MPSNQPWYRKAGVQAAFVTGLFVLIATTLTIVSQSKQASRKGTTAMIKNATNVLAKDNSDNSNINVVTNSGILNAIRDVSNAQINSFNLIQPTAAQVQGQINNAQQISGITQIFNNNNYITTNPAETELKVWISNIDSKLSATSNDIQLSRKDILALTSALKRLDERTEDIQRLPDGRTSFGGIVAGAHLTLMSDTISGFKSFTNQDYQAALDTLTEVISRFEAVSNSNILYEYVQIRPEWKGVIYNMASSSASHVGSNDLAYSFAKKAFIVDPTLENKTILVSAAANMGLKYAFFGSVSNSFELIKEAISTYESDSNLSNRFSKKTIYSLYNLAAGDAFDLGRTNESSHYLQIAEKVKGTNEFSGGVLFHPH